MIDRLLRLPEVIHLTGRKKSAIYSDIKRGEFPRPVQLGPQAVAWRSSQIEAWIESRETAPP